MAHVDQFGVALSAGDAVAVRHYDAAVAQLLTFDAAVLAEAGRAVAVDRSLVMGHVLLGLLYSLGTENSQRPDARAALEAARAVAGVLPREQLHLAAIAAWLRGDFTGACGHWEEILVEQPNDALAMFAAHQADFLLGRSSELRDRVARRLPELDQGSALEGHYFGMYAFGLEEMGDYGRAAAFGRRAVERCRRDAWAIHAVAHVFEMTNRVQDGRDWLTQRAGDWSGGSFLAVHHWWHLALLYADQQDWPRVRSIYDEHMHRDGATVMELLDASALLWRLKLYDVDTGDRWQPLADAWEPRAGDAWYAFNDVHAMMAFAGAGRGDAARRLLGALEAAANSSTANGAVSRDIGLPVATALLAYAEGRFAAAVDRLLPVRALAGAAGGSHAQRDVLAQTVLSAAEKSGRTRLARALLNERLELKPHSTLNRLWFERLAAGTHRVGGSA